MYEFVDRYIDSKMRIARGNKGSVFVHVREPESDE
jgi:hypothetical protein